VILVVALLYALFRLVVHGGYLAMMLQPESDLLGGMPEWTGSGSDPMVPPDLQIYLDAARHVLGREDLYLKGSLARLEEHYPYAPSFALAFVPFAWLSPVAVAIVHSVLHVAAYACLFVAWARIFDRLELKAASATLAWTAPLWLVFSAFWSDLGYLNIYLVVALLATLYTEAVLSERLGWSVFWLSIILQIKPHWAFATAVPLLLGRYRFFFKLLALAVLSYVGIVGLTALATGPSYALQQYADYLAFLRRLSRDFPWRGPESPFLGYNHSIKQIVFYIAGRMPAAGLATKLLKAGLLAPLGVVIGRRLVQGGATPPWRAPKVALDLAFSLYLGAFIWLDMVWELSLSIAIFPYLLATAEGPLTTVVAWVAFLPYALIDVWQVASLGLFGMDVIAPGPYVLTDPSIYVPMVMVLALSFYGLLIKRMLEQAPGPMRARA
jgi:hypothetical protein